MSLNFGTHTAGIPPASALVLCVLGWFPPPSPVKGDRGAPFGGIVADQLDIGVLVEIWVGVELASDKILDFA